MAVEFGSRMHEAGAVHAPFEVLTRKSFSFINALLMKTVLGFVICLIAIAVSQQLQGNSEIWMLWGVAAGAFGLGNILGFTYSTFGTESERFNEWVKVANTAVASVTAVDLIRDGSLIRVAFRSVASTCGIDGATGVVAAIAVAFFSGGFLMFYVYKRLVLNVLAVESEKFVDGYEQSVAKLVGTELPSETERSKATRELMKLRGEDKLEKAIVSLRGSELESGKAEVKAAIFDEQLLGAQQRVRDLLGTYPKDAELLYYAGYVEHLLGSSANAIEYFERSAEAPGTPPAVWKFLGYLYLWDSGKLERAIECSQKFSALFPEDPGAMLNLACAYGQMGPDSTYRAAALDLIKKLLMNSPKFKEKIKKLMVTGEDFEAWSKDDELLKLLESS